MAAGRVADVPNLTLDPAQLWIVEVMAGNYWSIFVLFALFVMMTSLGVLGFIRQTRVNRAGHLDDSSWFLIILIIIAIVSIGCFVAYIFLRGRIG
jgi:uncharacterized membrane protein YecN with MAPEG domain